MRRGSLVWLAGSAAVFAAVCGLGVSRPPAAGGAVRPAATAATATAATAAKAAAGSAGSAGATATTGSSGTTAAGRAAGGIPGLGAAWARRIPTRTRQVVVAYGAGRDASEARIAAFERTADGGWRQVGSWQGHNGLRGWTTDHHEGDLRSPEGLFTLTDAGGRLPDPGSRLPYHRSGLFTIGGRGFAGEPLAGAFDYVVAIDYNRARGRSPLDHSRPLGRSKGGSIWLHVDHGGPSHACVTVPRAGMAALLRWLDPADHPVVVMGDRSFLAAG